MKIFLLFASLCVLSVDSKPLQPLDYPDVLNEYNKHFNEFLQDESFLNRLLDEILFFLEAFQYTVGQFQYDYRDFFEEMETVPTGYEYWGIGEEEETSALPYFANEVTSQMDHGPWETTAATDFPQTTRLDDNAGTEEEEIVETTVSLGRAEQIGNEVTQEIETTTIFGENEQELFETDIREQDPHSLGVTNVGPDYAGEVESTTILVDQTTQEATSRYATAIDEIKA